jgi:hypothetical protein
MLASFRRRSASPSWFLFFIAWPAVDIKATHQSHQNVPSCSHSQSVCSTCADKYLKLTTNVFFILLPLPANSEASLKRFVRTLFNLNFFLCALPAFAVPPPFPSGNCLRKWLNRMLFHVFTFCFCDVRASAADDEAFRRYRQTALLRESMLKLSAFLLDPCDAGVKLIDASYYCWCSICREVFFQSGA